MDSFFKGFPDVPIPCPEKRTSPEIPDVPKRGHHQNPNVPKKGQFIESKSRFLLVVGAPQANILTC